MRLYSIDTLYGDHIGYTIANSETEAMGNNGENVTVIDVADVYSPREIQEIIDEELDESEDVIQALLAEYELL